MQKSINKSKQFLTLLLKLIIIGGAFYFIYERLSNESAMDFDRFRKEILSKQPWYVIVFILLLSVLNRFLEILKWKNLVQVVKHISVAESTKQVLGALTLALFTPNGIGEYAGKALFFEKNQAKQIIFLNLICNGVQLLLTVFFGVCGLLYLNTRFPIISSKIVLFFFGILVFLILVGIVFKKVRIGNYSVGKIIYKLNQIPKSIHKKISF
uniref:lysylphosphatidylglycerol synthase domain-containing protein n=1 Tax=Flavobacterium oreochromis TaxID=2906078 RepID=UPI002869B835|nr:lysylphosphatidylglycerol synthase domain-containing protein [Flavobacterium oreochromis]